uniref:Uncharacterized protein n=1 Tax=Acrobeloides nanus TaxID=290746 RepID=A0A914EAM6_9BILA
MFRAEEKERARWRQAEQAEMASHLSPAAQVAERQFTAIEHNPRLTPQEKNQQTQQLKNSLPKNIVNEIEQMFQNQMRQHQEAREAFHAAAMAKLSPEAREADAKLAESDRNPLIPPQQKVQYIQMFLNSLPKQVKDELDRALSG